MKCFIQIAIFTLFCLLASPSWALSPESKLSNSLIQTKLFWPNQNLIWLEEKFWEGDLETKQKVLHDLKKRGTVESGKSLLELFHLTNENRHLFLKDKTGSSIINEIASALQTFKTEILFSTLADSTNSFSQIVDAIDILEYSIDISLIPKLRKLYFSETHFNYKHLIANLIQRIPDNFLWPVSDGKLKIVKRVTFNRRYHFFDTHFIDTQLDPFRPSSQPIEIADVGVSDGRTTLEFAKALEIKKIPFQITAYDLYLSAFLVKNVKTQTEVLFTSDGKCHYFKKRGSLFLIEEKVLPKEVKSLQKLFLKRTNDRETASAEVFIEKISLLHPDAQRYAELYPDRLIFKEQDAWKPFSKKYDLIRVMALMIPEGFEDNGLWSYFSDAKIKEGLINLGRALKRKTDSSSGLLVGVNRGSTVYHDLYLLAPNFKLIQAQKTPNPFVSPRQRIGHRISLLPRMTYSEYIARLSSSL